MSDPHFKCSYCCKQKLEAPPDMSGERITCPTCGNELTVPLSAQPPLQQQSATQINFTYKAKSQSGQVLSGVVTAANRTDAINEIERHGHVPITVETEHNTKPVFNTFIALCAKRLPWLILTIPVLIWIVSSGMEEASKNMKSISLGVSVMFFVAFVILNFRDAVVKSKKGLPVNDKDGQIEMY